MIIYTQGTNWIAHQTAVRVSRRLPSSASTSTGYRPTDLPSHIPSAKYRSEFGILNDDACIQSHCTLCRTRCSGFHTLNISRHRRGLTVVSDCAIELSVPGTTGTVGNQGVYVYRDFETDSPEVDWKHCKPCGTSAFTVQKTGPQLDSQFADVDT